MRPDDDRLIPFGTGDLESDLQPLAEELAAAGYRAASTAANRPSLAFTADLRARLLDDHPASAPQPVAGIAGGGLQAVRPQVSDRASSVVPRARWAVVGLAAAIVVAVLGLDAPTFIAVPPRAHAAEAVGATLARAGTKTTLTPGIELMAGDRIATDRTGRATLVVGDGEVRLASSSTIALDALGADAVDLDQLAGRSWHRVGVEVGRYRVVTASVSWTASGTAFDLDRRPDGHGGEEVRAVGIEHDVRIEGPGVSAELTEGSAATIALGGADAAPDVRLGPITKDDMLDPWLLANAALDVALGFDAGILDDRLAEAPTATPTEPTDVTASPSTEPLTTMAPSEPAAPAAEAPAEKPTPKPTPKPTAKPTPKPTPAMASLELDATACHGGFTLLSWSKAPAAGFGHYQTLRSTSAEIKPVYPPKPPAVAPDGLYGTDRTWLAGTDRGLEPGETYSYRTMAFHENDKAYAASPVRTVTAKEVKGLGALDATVDAGTLLADWAAYPGLEGCFSWYKLVASTTDEAPSYLDGAPYIWVGESQGATSAVVEGLDPGTYHLRLEVLRESEGGPSLVARTEVATVTIP